MTLSRRDMLKSAALLGAGTLLPTIATPARAQATSARKLVMVLNSGGWDPTFVFDPKPGLPLVDPPLGAVANVGGHDIWSDASRPAVDAFFTTYGGSTAVINGVQVRSFVHSDCMKRMLTGSPSETTPDMGAIAAYELAPELPVPYLALGAFSRSGPYAAITGRAGTTNQLQALVDPTAAYGPAFGPNLPDFGTLPSNSEESAVKRFLEATAVRERKIRGQRGYNKKRIDDFIASLDRADTLGRFVREGASLGDRGYTPDLNFQIPLAVQALSEGLSHTAMLQSAPSWDTHTNNDMQGTYFQDLFTSLSGLMVALEAADLADTTTIMVLSEMGRTPKLNGDVGKDHWPVTSCMLIGAGVQGGRSYGGTNDELGAESIDLATGEVNASGSQLQTQNLVAGMLETIGVDPEPYFPGVEAFRGFRG